MKKYYRGGIGKLKNLLVRIFIEIYSKMNYGKRIETTKELREIQLELLLEFHEFCEENNINYSLAYGSLLGAIRHKGYIPWDDDIDVCMLRSEYEKLEKIFPENYKNRYSFYTLNRAKKWNRPYGKFFNSKTIEIEHTRNNVGIGIGIDIFPIDDVPDNHKKFERFRKRRLLLVKASTLKWLIWSKERSFRKNLIIAASQILLLPFPNRFLARLIDAYSRNKNNKGYKSVFRSCDTIVGKISFPKSLFDGYVDVPFENYTFKAMQGYKDYLHACYGDYMKLPPKEKQVSHHAFNAFWKN